MGSAQQARAGAAGKELVQPLGLFIGVKRSPKLWQLPCKLMGRSRDPKDMIPDIGEQQDSHRQFSIFKLLPI